MYPNAKSGIGKLYVAEILALALALLTILMGIIAVVAIAKLNESLAGVAGVLAIIAMLGAIVYLVIRIIGLIDAGKDEQAFKTALYCVVGALGISVLNFILGIAKAGSVVTTIVGLIGDILSLLGAVYTIIGVRNLAQKVNRSDVADFSRITMYLVVGATLLGIVLGFIGGVIPEGVASQVIEVIAAVISIVVEVVFIALLSKGKNMLRDA